MSTWKVVCQKKSVKMNDNSSHSPMLLKVLKNLIEPAIRFLDTGIKDRIAKAIELAAAAGAELDQMKDAPEETIESFFVSWTSQNNAKYLTQLLANCECYHTTPILRRPKILTEEFLALRDSVDMDRLGDVVKCAIDSMDIENLRVLLSDESGDSLVKIRRLYAKEVLEKIKYLYPSLYFPSLFGLYIDSEPFSLNDVFPLEILDKPYMLVLSQYGKCVASHFEKNLLCKLLSKEHREVIEKLSGKKFEVRYFHGDYFVSHAAATNLECNVKFLLDVNINSNGSYSIAYLLRTKSDKIFEMLMRTVSDKIKDKYEIFYNSTKDFSDNRIKIVLAQLALDTSKGLILHQVAYDNIKLFGYKNHYEICQEQVQWMKSVIIFETVTLLDVLDYNLEDLAKLVVSKNNIQNLLAQCQGEKLIDYYYSSLEEQLYTAIAVQDTRARAAEFIQRATGLFVILVIDKIMSYLSLKDLRFFALPVDP